MENKVNISVISNDEYYELRNFKESIEKGQIHVRKCSFKGNSYWFCGENEAISILVAECDERGAKIEELSKSHDTQASIINAMGIINLQLRKKEKKNLIQKLFSWND